MAARFSLDGGMIPRSVTRLFDQRSEPRVEPDEDRLEDGIAFAGVAKFPARVKCALLGWAAFKDAVLVAQTRTVTKPEGRS